MPRRTRLAIVLLLLLLLPSNLVSAPGPVPEWKARFDAANQALDEGRREQFRTEVEAAVEAARRKSDDAIALSDELIRLGANLDYRDNHDAARLVFEAALQLRSFAFGEQDWQTAEPLVHLSHVELGEKNYQRAEDLLRRALAIRREALGEVHLDVLQTYRSIGGVYLAQDKLIAADEAFGQAIARRAEVVGSGSVEFADALDEAALVYEYHDQFERADSLRERSRNLRVMLWGEHDARMIQYLLGYARSQTPKRADVAAKIYKQLWESAMEHHGDRSPVTATVLSSVAGFHSARKEDKLAEKIFRHAISVRSNVPGASDPESPDFTKLSRATADDLRQLGRIAQRQSRFDEAAQAFDQSYQTLAAILPASHIDLQWALRQAGIAYRGAGDYGMAMERFRELLDARTETFGEASNEVAQDLEELGDTCVSAADYAAAAGYYERMVAILEKQDPPVVGLEAKLFKLSGVYGRLGKTEQTNELNWRAIGLMLGNLRPGPTSGYGGVAVLIALLGLAFSAAVTGGMIWGGAAVSRRMLDFPAPALAPAGGVSSPAMWSPAAADAVDPPAIALEPEEGVPSHDGAMSDSAAPESTPSLAALDSFATTPPELSTPALASTPTLEPEQPGPPAPSPNELESLSEPGSPISAPPKRFQSHGFRFDGEGANLFSIWIVNLLLTLITFGIYYFWGKARIREYVYSRTSFDDDAFRFHGTGRELFIGWLKALPILVAFLYGPTVLVILWKSPQAEMVGVLAAFGLLFVVWPVAVVGAFRYRLSRSSWRGIHFSFRGRKLRYAFLAWGAFALWLLSLGLASPFGEVWLRRYLFNNAWFGDRQFRFEGRGYELFGPFMIAVILTPLTLGLYWFWYSAQRENYYWSRTAVAAGRFRCTLTGWKLCKLHSGNLLLLILTLGIAWPWTLMRTARLRLENVFLEGPLDLGSIRQDLRGASATGEGYADFLGIDFGI